MERCSTEKPENIGTITIDGMVAAIDANFMAAGKLRTTAEMERTARAEEVGKEIDVSAADAVRDIATGAESAEDEERDGEEDGIVNAGKTETTGDWIKVAREM